MTNDKEALAQELLQFIEESPTAFHAAANAAHLLREAEFEELNPEKIGKLTPGRKYFITRNDSSLIAFHMPEGEKKGFRITASHGDSPSFKIKETPETDAEGHCVKLNTEKYGGMIYSTWMDRPLSVAGRVIVKEDGRLVSKLINVKRDLMVIPNVAIHFNREINSGYTYNPQVDLLPLFAQKNSDERDEAKDSDVKAGRLQTLIAGELAVRPEDILATDLYLYNRDKGRRMGEQGEFIGSPRLDDLECVFGTLKGFLTASDKDYIPVFALFDNEEIGSMTKQGAASTFLSDVLNLICEEAGCTNRRRQELVSNGFLVSADNAHGVHPNHPEKSDPTNRPFLNGGIVLKFQGSQKYTTDAYSAAVIRDICKEAGVPCQNFANRADIAGGSTLGNISSAQVSIPAADIGLAQLAMHSAFETAGTEDIAYLVHFCETYYNA